MDSLLQSSLILTEIWSSDVDCIIQLCTLLTFQPHYSRPSLGQEVLTSVLVLSFTGDVSATLLEAIFGAGGANVCARLALDCRRFGYFTVGYLQAKKFGQIKYYSINIVRLYL